MSCSLPHGAGGLRLNYNPASQQEHRRGQQPVIAVTPWEQQLGRFKALEDQVASRPMRSIAWALALAASGRIHAVATFEPENEWDVAAGALLIEEAGGAMEDGEGKGLVFNRPEPRYWGIIATHATCPDPVARQLRSLFLMRESRGE